MKNMTLKIFASLALAVILTGGNCEKKEAAGGLKEVDSCQAQTDEKVCNVSKKKGGKACFFSPSAPGSTTGLCQEAGAQLQAAEKCKDLAKDLCLKSIQCTYDFAATPNVCKDADPGIKNTCKAIEDKATCDEFKNTCIWKADPANKNTQGSCDAIIPTPTAKTVTVYELAKVDKTNAAGYDIVNDSHIAGLTASLDGSKVFIVGSQATQLRVIDANPVVFRNAPLGDWGATGDAANRFGKAEDRNMAADFSGATIVRFTPTEAGLLFSLSGNRGLVYYNGEVGDAKDVTNVYAQGGGNNLDDGLVIPFLAKRSDNTLVMYTRNTNTAANHVRFKAFIDPIAQDDVGAAGTAGELDGPWNGSLDKNGTGTALDEVTSAFAQGSDGTLYLAQTAGIQRLAGAGVGINGQGLIGDADLTDAASGNTNFALAKFSLDGGTTPNNRGVSVMKMVEDKYLLVGFNSNAANKGGLCHGDVTANPIVWSCFGAGLALTVNDIGLESHDTMPKSMKNKRAVISTDKGLLIFENGNIIAPFESAPQQKLISSNTNMLKSNVTSKAVDGFSATSAPLPLAAGAGQAYVGAAQVKSGKWYIAIKGDGNDDGGIFTLEIKETPVP